MNGAFQLRRLVAAAILLAIVAIVSFAIKANSPGSVHNPYFVQAGPVKMAPVDTHIRQDAYYDLKSALQSLGLSQFGLGGPQLSSHTSSIERLLDYGGVDRNIITNAETFPRVTQSESFIAANGNMIVVAYNDTRGAGLTPHNLGGVSWSTDGGTTWTRVTGPDGQSPFSNTEGDPVVLWNAERSTWYSFWLSGHCGSRGLAAFSSANGMDWSFSSCAAYDTERESGWVDNNPSSSTYGRMWISTNSRTSMHFVVSYSDDGGATWSPPYGLTANRQISNVQMTGSPDITGANGGATVFVQAISTLSLGLQPRSNIIYRSTDGGQSWTEHFQNGPYPPPGVGTCSGDPNSFASIYPGYWRDLGWGQPGVGPGGVIHYAFTMHGPGNDAGNIIYVRSTDNGSTWAQSVQLNTDSGLASQWMPSLAVNAQGSMFVGWYDRRLASNGNYDRYGRASLDNGATWQPDMLVSDIEIPLPAQVDPSGDPCYAGDYDYAISYGNEFYQTWTDGRIEINGVHQQDVYFDKITLSQGTPTPTVTGTPPTPTHTRTPRPTYTVTATATPALCEVNYLVTVETGATLVRGTEDVGNHCGQEPCLSYVTLPFPYTLYDQTFSGASVSTSGTLQFNSTTGSGNSRCLPVGDFSYTIFGFWDFLCTDDCYGYQCDDCGIFTSVSGSAPNRVFNIEWRAILITVGGPRVNFVVRLFENQQKFEIIYGPTHSGNTAVVGVQEDSNFNNFYTQYSCDTGSINPGLKLTFEVPTCVTPSPPAATPTVPAATPTVESSATLIAPTATPCLLTFTDVPADHTFYANIHCLACRGIISGYNDSTFRPDNLVTRGQLAKIVSNAAGFTEDAGSQIFEDVPSTQPFYAWINRLTRRGYMSGYPCGSPGEPCVNGDRPYFRPVANATRAQTSKIVSNAARYNEPPIGQTFQDVPPTHPFYEWIQRLATRNVMQGYACGGPGEPCIANRPYFRPSNNVTRGQSAKIVANTFYPNCVTP